MPSIAINRCALFTILLGVLLPSVFAQDLFVTKTAHYELHSDFPSQEAKAQLQVMEAAWIELTKFFGASPLLKKSQRLKVFLFEKHESFLEQIKRDNAKPPGSTAGGYYWPPSKTVYQYRQPTIYYTRQLLIHECIHQFHFLSSTNNKSPKDEWFIEGLAEYLSRHSWDGKTLRLGVVPLITLKDYPAKALALMSTPGYNLQAMISSSRKSNRPEQWALIHWLCRPDKRAQKRWRSVAKSLNQGTAGSDVVKRLLGSSKEPLQKILAWLKANQEPMKQVFNQWEGTSATTIKGEAKVVSMCRTKAPCSEFSATIVEPQDKTRWSGGILLHWNGPQDYTILLVQSDRWKIDRRRNNKWTNLFRGSSLPRPKEKRRHRILATRNRKKISIKINGRPIATLPEPTSPMGLCLDNCTLTFEKISWR